MPASKVSFPALNGIRFWASLFVVIHHIEQSKMFFGHPHIFRVAWVDNLGSIGVSLFFVLSGFLITYLLLQEQKNNHSVRIRHFYMRRVLRIWPLYFAVLFAAFFVLPHFYPVIGWGQNIYASFSTKLLLYALILPNVCVVLFPEVLAANQLWSIGVEEQFYLVWPFLVKLFRRDLLWVFVSILIGKSVLNIVVGHFSAESVRWSKIGDIIHQFEIEKLVLGSMGAYFLFHGNKRVLNIVYHPGVQVIGWVGLAFFLGWHVHVKLYGVILGALLLIVLMNICRRSHVLTDHPVINYLGKISYSTYMLHQFAILLALIICKQYFHGAAFQAALYASTLLLTVIFSIVSYEWLEKPFLRLKTRYEVI